MLKIGRKKEEFKEMTAVSLNESCTLQTESDRQRQRKRKCASFIENGSINTLMTDGNM